MGFRLWPRGQIDLGWRELFYAALAVFRAEPEADSVWPNTPPHLTALSVRTAWDALLSVVGWPPGSEVIFSEANIPDMVRLIELHGYVPVAARLDPETLSVAAHEVERLISPRTRAMLVSPLFGARMPLGAIGTLAHQHRLLLVEDCAQAYGGPDWCGSPEANVSLFSFGLIKTLTAMGGAVSFVRDPELRTALHARLQTYPSVSTGAFLQKWARTIMLHSLGHPVAFQLFWQTLAGCGLDPDVWLSKSTRGFQRADLQAALRRRPHRATLRLLRYRLRRDSAERLSWRVRRGRQALAELPSVLGRTAEHSAFWALPVRVSEREKVIRAARQAGFDLSFRASSLQCHGDLPSPLSQALESALYLPIGTRMPEQEWARLLDFLRQV